MKTSYIGIDPGKSGAIVIIDQDLKVDLAIPKMPWLNERIDSSMLYCIIAKGIQDYENTHIICEKVHSMPRDSSKAAFTFGGAYHGALAVVDLFDIPLTLVSPQSWKKVMLKDKKKEKQDSINRARELFPSLRSQLKTKSSHNLAEAALIAAYGVTNWNN